MVVDNFDNNSPRALLRFDEFADSDALKPVRRDGVIHFARHKAVRESVADPLRYVYPVGAHPSGRIGEDPLGIPNNLFPFITQVAAGRRDKLRVFGQDYPTPDGTGIRDYLHVMDLAEAHGVTLTHLLNQEPPTQLTVNIGTGTGLSVLDVIKGFEQATGITIPYEVVARRPGDVPRLQACPRQAEAVLGWTARRGLVEMCRDGWAWQQANPMGYRSAP